MLPKTWRLTAYNNAGVNINIAVTTVRAKRATDGSLDYEAAEATLVSNAALASGAYQTGTTQDNSTNEWEEADCVLAITPATAPAAGVSVTIYFERSTDGGTKWPDNGKGFPLITVTPSGTAEQVWDFSI